MKFCIYILFTILGTSQAVGLTIPGTSPLPEEDLAKVLAVMKGCPTDEDLKNDHKPMMLVRPEGNSELPSSRPEKFSSAYMLYTNLSYSQDAWKAIVSAAEKLKELDWVVVSHMRNVGVVSLNRWESEYKGKKELCFFNSTNRLSCDKKVSLALSKAIGSRELESRDQPNNGRNIYTNCLFDDHSTMLKALMDNGYSYDKNKGWIKDTNAVPQGASPDRAQ